MGSCWRGRAATWLTPGGLRPSQQRNAAGVLLWFSTVLIVSVISQPAMAGRQDCFAITDRDQRHLCLADYDGKGVCTLIEDRDLANYCRATHGDGKGTCVLIEDEEVRARCRARFP